MKKAVRTGLKCLLALGMIVPGAAAISVTSASAAGDFNRAIEGPPGGYGSLSWVYHGQSSTTYYTIKEYLDTTQQYWKKVYYDKNNQYVKSTFGIN
ncbi:hypothetical protein AS034_18735 [[Bacillus] enclensis]|uniref:Lactococcin 972 family bacteriocin n=1 Tax=[Bacillus] enclensis TaxID=1402860 RepID=A0A0V8HAA8_9BACI|nr:hypothetical protein [[Bacillus] enclensis]KSU59468.1 hypothetical protein AS034_18735 [[Bacillus] enclensis]SCC30932.1 hypothetical protein GA0061094_3876 [[Bacillus] enclensis]